MPDTGLPRAGVRGHEVQYIRKPIRKYSEPPLRLCACARARASLRLFSRVCVRGCAGVYGAARYRLMYLPSSEQLRGVSRRRLPQGAAANGVSLFLSFLGKERNTIISARPRAVSRKAPWGRALQLLCPPSLVQRLSSLAGRGARLPKLDYPLPGAPSRLFCSAPLRRDFKMKGVYYG